MRVSGTGVPVERGKAGHKMGGNIEYRTFRNTKDIRDDGLKTLIQRIIVLVHKHPRILLETECMGEKHWFGCHLSLLAQGEGEREMKQTPRGHSRIYTPLRQVFRFISFVEMLGAGWSGCHVDNVGTFTRVDLVQRVGKTPVQGQDVYRGLPGGG